MSPREAPTASVAKAPPAPNQTSACVVLRRAGQAANGRLERWLSDRGLHAITFNDAAGAFAAMCLTERGQASRAAWGLPRTESTMLLIEQPGSWRDLDDLIAAVTKYTSDAGIATIDGDEVQVIRRPRIEPPVIEIETMRSAKELAAEESGHVLRIAGSDDEAVQPSRPAESPQPGQRERPAPKLTLTLADDEIDHAHADAESPVDDGQESDDEPVRVTRDELSMLLGDDGPAIKGHSG